MTVTVLPDARLLVAGGRPDGTGPATSTAYILSLDTRTGTVNANLTTPLATPRAGHQAALLCDGTVLVSGGDGAANGERYNPPQSGRAMGKRRDGDGDGVPSPRRLAVELVDEEFAIFSWEEAPPPAVPLTEAERDVLNRVASGASNAAIAKARKSSVRTVANQVASLLRKLGADSRYDLIRRFGPHGDRPAS
jgi:DNA-binding NarL/FixJ family response regulator